MKQTKTRQAIIVAVLTFIILSFLSAASYQYDLFGAAGGTKGKPPTKTPKADKPSPEKPTKEEKERGGNCVGFDMKLDYSAGSYTISAPAGKVVTAVGVKAATNCYTFTSDGSNGCYAVSGIGTPVASVRKVGSGSACPDISHVEAKFGGFVTITPPDDDGSPYVCVEFIVFHTFRDDDLEIYSLFDGPEGSPEAQLFNLSLSPTSEDTHPSRSWNDKLIVFESNRDGNVELYLTDPYGSFQTRLTETEFNNINPMFMPDNKHVIYQSDAFGNWDIFILNIETLETTRLTTDSNDDVFPYASPDPNWITFQSNRSGNWDVYLLNIETGDETQLTSGAENEIYPAWSPNGIYLAYLSDAEGIYDLIVYDLETDEKKIISAGPEMDADNHAWSPEGYRIAYQSFRDGNLDIYTYDLRTGIEYRVTDYEGPDSSPTWNCGGQMVSFTTVRDGNPNIYSVIWTGGPQSYLTIHPATDKWAEWSPSKELGSGGR